MVKKKRGFTLIELIAVLVIMAILALIVTPLVMRIIRKARISADKRSIDAYGRSIELAVASYLLDTGKFPTDISQLTIEYSGSEVVCETTQLNSDSSVYLTGCTVAGRSVDYTYGEDKTPPAPTYEAYTVSATAEDTVTYNGEDYYVIENSGTTESTVKLLKAEPLTTQEANQYGGVGTSNNHVNMYVTSDTSAAYYQTADDRNGYGGMAYYSSATCGYSGDSGCTTSYASSEIKYVVDAWKTAKAPAATEARLMTYDEYTDLTEVGQVCTGSCYDAIVPKYDWMHNSNYRYWTMSPWNDSSSNVWCVDSSGYINGYVSNDILEVRPVIVLSKSELSS